MQAVEDERGADAGEEGHGSVAQERQQRQGEGGGEVEREQQPAERADARRGLGTTGGEFGEVGGECFAVHFFQLGGDGAVGRDVRGQRFGVAVQAAEGKVEVVVVFFVQHRGGADV